MRHLGDALRRVALFLAVGGFGVFVNLGAFAAARSAVGETAASVVGAAAGVLSNFALHVRLTFRDRVAAGGLAAWARLFGEFCASSAVAFGSVMLLLLSRLPVGLAKQTVTASRAVVSDVTPPAQRSSALARLFAGCSLGYAVGPFFGGKLAERAGGASPAPAAAAAATGPQRPLRSQRPQRLRRVRWPVPPAQPRPLLHLTLALAGTRALTRPPTGRGCSPRVITSVRGA